MKKEMMNLCLMICSFYPLIGQSKVNVYFQAQLDKQPIKLWESYISSRKDSFEIHTFKFYISNIEIFFNDQFIWKEPNSFHLLDLADTSSQNIALLIPNTLDYNQIKFNLGIDSATNVSGAMGGDLDPTKGMYWTWQNGYIHVKIEGRSSSCMTRKNEFQFHLGGYAAPFNTCMKVKVPVDKKSYLEVKLNMNTFFDAVDLSKQNRIMSPGEEAQDLFKKIAKSIEH